MSKQDEYRDRLLGHADEADGIEEYDNPLPDWWVGLFWFTIVFAVAYTLHYHFIADRSQVKELASELAAAEVRWPGIAEGPFTVTPELAEQGAEVYRTNCIACHGADLTGGIGPDLTDEVWIHGGEAEAVLTIVMDGVPSMGMPAWGPILGPERARQVAAYVLSMGN